ncbi:hypothetical protein SAMN05443572_107191 [Myxococcus fulvus]|uniref:Uncharacterized protein n=1 Tax=Myxococcus fulvus TaxID=33 RepID=A0A511T8H0_MYXFU|nr:hypothetical protein [Myxococcus fulvus]GEN09903.1 hypothetical protein MFU01_49400 [Myxococcus fulvus]SEU26016.1 hypothetical protein SAMN05443572_107191 [Myxococcus fulvus]
MILFLRSSAEANSVITTPAADIVVRRATAKYAQLAREVRVIVPWYDIQPDPEKFGQLLLQVAERDPVCCALLDRAGQVWGMDFSIDAKAFRAANVQKHYLKQLQIWLSPLSGNLGHRDAHRPTVDEQFDRMWGAYGLKKKDLEAVAALPFFKTLKVGGRRDRIQFYRNVTEAARALIGEVTSWPSRTIEKISMLYLLGSPGLATYQRTMLAAVVRAMAQGQAPLQLNYTMWEYLPYYLRGTPGEDTDVATAQPRVLGAIHHCLSESPATQALASAEAIEDFRTLDGGKEFNRWRLLPPVVRCQVLLSDLSRMFPWRGNNGRHQRLEFAQARLDGLPSLAGFAAWGSTMEAHAQPTPHDPGHDFPHAAGWTRHEFCPNVVSSRLLLAPLYAGTSGHTQGRISAWTMFAQRFQGIAAVPIGVVISVGYSVLWRLYYDKRTTSFHTLFEAIQGSHVDAAARDLRNVARIDGDVLWNTVLDSAPTGKIDVKGFWNACVAHFNKPGPFLPRQLKLEISKARTFVTKACPGSVIPRWSATEDADATGSAVAVWDDNQNLDAFREEEVWQFLVETFMPPPGASSSSTGLPAASSAAVVAPSPAKPTMSDLDKLAGLIGDYL